MAQPPPNTSSGSGSKKQANKTGSKSGGNTKTNSRSQLNTTSSSSASATITTTPHHRSSPSTSTATSISPAASTSSIPSSIASLTSSQNAVFAEKIRASGAAVSRGDYAGAVTLCTEALAIDPNNYVLYANRSAAHAKLRNFQKALKDARKSRAINPTWAKVGDFVTD